jgi:hypothetical protein
MGEREEESVFASESEVVRVRAAVGFDAVVRCHHPYVASSVNDLVNVADFVLVFVSVTTVEIVGVTDAE